MTTGGGAQADRYFVPPSPRGWNVLALRPIGSGGNPTDADLRLFDGFDHATLLKGSNADPGTVDFIVGVMPCTFGDQMVYSSTFAYA